MAGAIETDPLSTSGYITNLSSLQFVLRHTRQHAAEFVAAQREVTFQRQVAAISTSLATAVNGYDLEGVEHSMRQALKIGMQLQFHPVMERARVLIERVVTLRSQIRAAVQTADVEQLRKIVSEVDSTAIAVLSSDITHCQRLLDAIEKLQRATEIGSITGLETALRTAAQLSMADSEVLRVAQSLLLALSNCRNACAAAVEACAVAASGAGTVESHHTALRSAIEQSDALELALRAANGVDGEEKASASVSLSSSIPEIGAARALATHATAEAQFTEKLQRCVETGGWLNLKTAESNGSNGSGGASSPPAVSAVESLSVACGNYGLYQNSDTIETDALISAISECQAFEFTSHFGRTAQSIAQAVLSVRKRLTTAFNAPHISHWAAVLEAATSGAAAIGSDRRSAQRYAVAAYEFAVAAREAQYQRKVCGVTTAMEDLLRTVKADPTAMETHRTAIQKQFDRAVHLRMEPQLFPCLVEAKSVLNDVRREPVIAPSPAPTATYSPAPTTAKLLSRSMDATPHSPKHAGLNGVSPSPHLPQPSLTADLKYPPVGVPPTLNSTQPVTRHTHTQSIAFGVIPAVLNATTKPNGHHFSVSAPSIDLSSVSSPAQTLRTTAPAPSGGGGGSSASKKPLALTESLTLILNSQRSPYSSSLGVTSPLLTLRGGIIPVVPPNSFGVTEPVAETRQLSAAAALMQMFPPRSTPTAGVSAVSAPPMPIRPVTTPAPAPTIASPLAATARISPSPAPAPRPFTTPSPAVLKTSPGLGVTSIPIPHTPISAEGVAANQRLLNSAKSSVPQTLTQWEREVAIFHAVVHGNAEAFADLKKHYSVVIPPKSAATTASSTSAAAAAAAAGAEQIGSPPQHMRQRSGPAPPSVQSHSQSVAHRRTASHRPVSTTTSRAKPVPSTGPFARRTATSTTSLSPRAAAKTRPSVKR